jgi:hypothetical protein
VRAPARALSKPLLSDEQSDGKLEEAKHADPVRMFRPGWCSRQLLRARRLDSANMFVCTTGRHARKKRLPVK